MARLAGGPGSRQSQTSAPQTRTTRSQSREVSEAPSSQQQQQQQRKRGRPTKSAASKKRGATPAQAVNDLGTVDEDVTSEDQLRAALLHDEREAPASTLEHARCASGLSGISGTTVKTSFSHEEIAGLDADIMVDTLPTLARAADELAELLTPADAKLRPVVLKEIRTKGSKLHKLYTNRLAALNLHKSNFGSTEYIQPSVVLRALFGVDNLNHVSEGPWRPDSLIYKFNLAQMLRAALVVLSGNTQIDIDGSDAIENLDVYFAAAIAGKSFSKAAFELSLSLMTQLAIIRLQVHSTSPSFEPEEIVARVFWVDNAGPVFRHSDALHMTTLPQQQQQTYADDMDTRANNIIDILRESDVGTALVTLRAAFPWYEFVDHVLEYYRQRKTELDQQITAAGGVVQLMRGLATQVEQRADAREAELKRQSFSAPGTTPKKSFGKGGIRALKKRERQLAANEASSTAPAVAPAAQMVAQTEYPTNQPARPLGDDWQMLEDDAEPPQAALAQSVATASLGVLADDQDREFLSNLQANLRQDAAARSRNQTIAARQGASQPNNRDNGVQLTRYTAPAQFRYPASSAPAPGPYYHSPASNPAKRPRQTIEEEDPADFDPSQDQGFQKQALNTTAADERRREAPQAQRHLAVHITSPTPGPSGTQASPSPNPSKRQRLNPGSSIPPPLPALDPEDNKPISSGEVYRRATIAARHTTAMATLSRPPQNRIPWSESEEDALLDLVETECDDGISYAKLKSLDSSRPAGANGPRLAGRDAESIRFKLRNMKFVFLKAGNPLPRNFEKIVLDKKFRDKLLQLGIPYYQESIRGGGLEME